MLNSNNKSLFTLTIEGQTPFRVLSFEGTEVLDQPYEIEVELVAESSDIALEEYLHKPAYLAFDDQGNGIHGYVMSFGVGKVGKRFTHYHLTLEPRLAYLHYATHQRIFQNLTVPNIIAQVLERQGILSDAYRFIETRIPLPVRDYCVQYKETDLAFIQRLCADEGLTFSFRHSPEGHELVFGDIEDSFPKLAATPFHHDAGLVPEHPVIDQFDIAFKTRTSKTRHRDYNFENPGRTLDTHANSGHYPELEDYHFTGPGFFKDEKRGTLLANIALERHRRDYQMVGGASNQPTLRSGALLPLTHHERADLNAQWLIVGVTHEGKQPQVLEQDALPAANEPGEFTQGYRNTFLAIPKETAWRPVFKGAGPIGACVDTAVITGTPGEEVACDEYGRVHVRFHWDLTDGHSGSSSGWVRVGTCMSGVHFGAIGVPRVGMEVLVQYLYGDPDQPIILGCVPNHSTPPPYALPANKTRSVLRTHSTPNGTGYNELHMEDRTGQERVYVRAERDMEQLIQHDSRTQVGNDKFETVLGNSYRLVQGERHQTIQGASRIQILGDYSVSVASDNHQQVGGNLSMEAGMRISLSSGETFVIHAGASLTLKAGGHHVVISPGAITSSVPIQVGGVPMAATPANPLTAITPDALTTTLLVPVIAPQQRSALLLQRERCVLCEGGQP